MAKVGGPLSVVKVCTSMLCAQIGYRWVGGPLSVVNVFAQNWTSHVHSPLLQSSANFVGYCWSHPKLSLRGTNSLHPPRFRGAALAPGSANFLQLPDLSDSRAHLIYSPKCTYAVVLHYIAYCHISVDMNVVYIILQYIYIHKFKSVYIYIYVCVCVTYIHIDTSACTYGSTQACSCNHPTCQYNLFGEAEDLRRRISGDCYGEWSLAIVLWHVES